MGISPRSRCSARSSSALIAYSPLAEILIGASSPPAEPALERAGRRPREVGDDDVGARAADGRQRLQHRALLVEPAELTGGPDHRVLAGYRVGGQRYAELELRARDDVEVGQRGLDHDDVGALVEVQRDLSHRLLGVGRIHLVRAPVAELRRRLRGGSEGLEEARGILRRVRHDRRLDERRLVERLADGAHAPVHHVGGRDHVGAGVRVRHRGTREQLEGRIVAHRTVLDHAAVAVARVFAEADVGDDEQVRHGVLHRAHGLLHDAVIGVGLGAARILLRRNTEEQYAGDAHAGGILAFLDQLIHGEAVLAGHGCDRLSHAAAVHDEQGIDEVVDRQRRLADEFAEQRFFAQAARAEHAVGHHSLLLPRGAGRFGSRANHSAIARARAGIVYSAGMMSVARPYSAAVAAVIGPMEATTTRPRQARRSASLNISAKFRAVDDEVKVTASTAPSLRTSPSRAALPSARRVAYAATSTTSTPSARSDVTSTSRVWAARGSSTRSPRASSPRRRSTRPSARYSAGTTSTRTPCSRRASAVAGPMAATRRPARVDQAIPSAVSRRSTMVTPFTLVKTSHEKLDSAPSAASSGSHEVGGPMMIAGASMTRAPAASRSCVKRCACAAAR